MSGKHENWKSLPVKILVCTGHKHIEPQHERTSILIKDLETFYSTVNDTLTMGDLCTTLRSKIGVTLDRLGITVPDDMFEVYVYMTAGHIDDISMFNIESRPIWTELGISQYKQWNVAMPISILGYSPVTKPYLRVVLMSPEVTTIGQTTPTIIVSGPEDMS